MLKKFISLAAVAASIFGCSGSGSSDGPSGPGAATLEDLPNCTENREGEEFTLADNGFVYRCEDGAWEFVSAPLDTASSLDDLPNCTGKIDGDSVLVKGENAVFQCTGGKWKKVRSLGMTVATADDLVSCTSRRDGDSAYVAEVHSIYSCTDGKWNKVATLMDTVKTADDMPGCSDKYDGDSTYVQSDSSVYICMQKKWRLLGESVSTEDDMKNCTESREDMRIFIVDIRKSLICRDGKWYSFKLADLIEDEETEAPAESSSSGNKWEELPLSSSSAKSSSSVASSSSIASSSSEKSSSSVASSSSVKYWTLTDSRDGQTYKTVTIGTQTWMAENLNYPTDNSYCYGDDPANCQEYGRLYTWSAAMGVCPTGWHLPSKEEFGTLLSNVLSAAMPLSHNLRSSGLGDGADRYGFSALPAGYYDSSRKEFYSLGSYTGFWFSTEKDSNYVFSLGIDGYAYVRYDLKYDAFSVRCLQDSNEGSEASSSSSQAKPSSSSSSIKDGSEYNASVKTLTDPRDGRVYKIVTIGTQTWMAENLNYAYLQPTDELDSSSFCYNNDPAMCKTYGRLYLWSAAMDSAGVLKNDGKGKGCGDGEECGVQGPVQGICPTGWHLPSDAEFETLLSYVGSDDEERSNNLRSTGWGNGADRYGFSALPAGGYYRDDKKFYGLGDGALFWSSTEDDSDYAYRLYIDVSYAGVGYFVEYSGHSVRCLQD